MWRRKFFSIRFTVTHEGDRAGRRLAGPLPPPPVSSAAPSEPVTPGTVQIPPDGRPLILLADGPTVGGYPFLGVLTPLDLGRLARCAAGAPVRFRVVEAGEAQQAYRRAATWLDAFRARVRSGNPAAGLP